MNPGVALTRSDGGEGPHSAAVEPSPRPADHPTAAVGTPNASASGTGHEVTDPPRRDDRPAAVERVPSRSVVRAGAGCPACGAQPGSPCMGRRGARLSNHMERVDQYLSGAAGPNLPTPRQ